MRILERRKRTRIEMCSCEADTLRALCLRSGARDVECTLDWSPVEVLSSRTDSTARCRRKAERPEAPVNLARGLVEAKNWKKHLIRCYQVRNNSDYNTTWQ